jgi:hypothetical protein
MQAQIDQLSTNLGAAQSDIRRMEQELKQRALQLEREGEELGRQPVGDLAEFAGTYDNGAPEPLNLHHRHRKRPTYQQTYRPGHEIVLSEITDETVRSILYVETENQWLSSPCVKCCHHHKPFGGAGDATSIYVDTAYCLNGRHHNARA